MLKRTMRSRLDGATGAAIIEAAIIMPIFLLLVIGIFEYGRLMMMRQLVDNAAREGARYAVVHTYDKTTTDIQDHVRKFFGNMTGVFTGLTIQVFEVDPVTGNNVGVWSDAGYGEPIAVVVDVDFKPVLPGFLFLPSTFTVQGFSIMRSEAN